MDHELSCLFNRRPSRHQDIKYDEISVGGNGVGLVDEDVTLSLVALWEGVDCLDKVSNITGRFRK